MQEYHSSKEESKTMNVIFKIETSNGIESYFLENFTDEKDIHNELSDYGYCDVYEIIDIQEVKNDYMIERYRVAYEWLKHSRANEDIEWLLLATNENIKEDILYWKALEESEK